MLRTLNSKFFNACLPVGRCYSQVPSRLTDDRASIYCVIIFTQLYVILFKAVFKEITTSMCDYEKCRPCYS